MTWNIPALMGVAWMYMWMEMAESTLYSWKGDKNVR